MLSILRRRSVLMGTAGLAFSAGLGRAQSTDALGEEKSYLAKLRSSYRLDEVVSGSHNAQEVVRRLTHWTHAQWEHGQNMPTHMDALTTLGEAKTRGGFRCTEYAEVLAAACSAMGVPARPVAIMQPDTSRSGAAHVVAEAYDRETGTWIHADAQFDLMALAHGRPVGVAGFGTALKDGSAGVLSDSGVTLERYAEFVSPYIFYLDARVNLAFSPEARRAGSHKELVYLPPGAPELVEIQGWKIPAVYTRSLQDFYAPPQVQA